MTHCKEERNMRAADGSKFIFPADGLSAFFDSLVFEKHSRKKIDTKSLLVPKI